MGLQLLAAVVTLAFVAAGSTHPLWIFAPMALLYFGQGLFMPHLTAIAVSLAPSHATGVGSSTLGFLNQLVSAVCVQAMGMVGRATARCRCWRSSPAAAAFQLVVLRLSPRMEAGARGS